MTQVEAAGREALDPALKVNVFACPVHNSKQQFPGMGSVLLLRYFPPNRRHESGAAGEMRPPRWDFQQGWSWVRVGKDFLPHTVPSRSGRVLQALVGAQESFAVGTVVVHVLQGVHTERDEAAARYAPEQAQAPTGEPGEGAGVIGQLGHNHLVAGRATHLDRAVEKGDWLLHVDRLHSN